MKTIIKKYIGILITLLLLSTFITILSVSGGIYGLFYSSFILLVLLYIIKPLVDLLLFPLHLLTLNISRWIIFYSFFYVWLYITPAVTINNWYFPGLNLGSLKISSIQLSLLPSFIIIGLIFYIINKLLNFILI